MRIYKPADNDKKSGKSVQAGDKMRNSESSKKNREKKSDNFRKLMLEPRELLGLFGRSTDKSLSPIIHNGVYQKRSWPAVYLPFSLEPEELKAALQGIRALKFVGINVTNPYKQDVIPLLDELDQAANRIGAVNTIQLHRQKLIGYNTDYLAVKELLSDWQKSAPHPINSALVLGAGGAARAVTLACLESGLEKLYISNRTRQKAVKLKDDFKKHADSQLMITEWKIQEQAEIVREVDLVVDATTLGWQGKLFPGAEKGLQDKTAVFDLSYGKPVSRLLKLARKRGCFSEDGSRMLLFQAREADKIWFADREDAGPEKYFTLDLLPQL